MKQWPTLAFIDTETTGLDAVHHQIWEVAVIRCDPVLTADNNGPTFQETVKVWQLPVDPGRADPVALKISGYLARRHPRYTHSQSTANLANFPVTETTPGRGPSTDSPVSTMREWADTFVRFTWGAHVVGAVPSFDTERLSRLLREHYACPGWHYQPVDVEALAAGFLSVSRQRSHPDRGRPDRHPARRSRSARPGSLARRRRVRAAPSPRVHPQRSPRR